MLQITVKYFASYYDITRRRQEQMEMEEGSSVADLLAQVIQRYPQVERLAPSSICALNRSYVPTDTRLHDRDEVVFVPPMGGGAF